tara:strand:- start:84 stop:254 length:171 start_codon:yes stop_codon:yes gene_type:complete
MEQILILLFIGYAIGFIIIAYFGITGVNEIIEFKNRQHKLSKSFERQKQMEFDFDK